MAIESQGVLIRRASSVLATAASSVITVAASGATWQILSSATAVKDFGTLGFSSGMRVAITSGNNNNTAIYTIDSVASSVIKLYGTATADASTAHSITGYTMNSIGSVVSFNGPTGSANIIDITALDSTAKRKLVGIRDEGQLSLDILLDTSDAQQTKLRVDRAARTIGIYDIKLTDSTVQPTGMFFDAYITGFSVTGGVEQAVKASIQMELTSAVHWIDKV